MVMCKSFLKKLTVFILILTSMSMAMPVAGVYGGDNIRTILVTDGSRDMIIDGEIVPLGDDYPAAQIVPPGRFVIPLTAVTKLFDAEALWDGITGAVKIKHDGKTITLWIGKNEITIDGEALTIDTAPVIIQSRTCVPLAVIAQALGCEVRWNAETRTAEITCNVKDKEPEPEPVADAVLPPDYQKRIVRENNNANEAAVNDIFLSVNSKGNGLYVLGSCNLGIGRKKTGYFMFFLKDYNNYDDDGSNNFGSNTDDKNRNYVIKLRTFSWNGAVIYNHNYPISPDNYFSDISALKRESIPYSIYSLDTRVVEIDDNGALVGVGEGYAEVYFEIAGMVYYLQVVVR